MISDLSRATPPLYRFRTSGMRSYNPEQIMLSAAVGRSSRDVNVMKEKLIFSGELRPLRPLAWWLCGAFLSPVVRAPEFPRRLSPDMLGAQRAGMTLHLPACISACECSRFHSSSSSSVPRWRSAPWAACVMCTSSVTSSFVPCIRCIPRYSPPLCPPRPSTSPIIHPSIHRSHHAPNSFPSTILTPETSALANTRPSLSKEPVVPRGWR